MVKKQKTPNKINFRVYNKSSELMKELEDRSVNLVVTSPPYNIGTKYGKFDDTTSFQDYLGLLSAVIKESYRVQTPNGKIVVEVADSIRSGEDYVQLAGLFQSICVEERYSLVGRDINFIRTKNHIELPDHCFDDNYSTKQNGHSNCHQVLTFSKYKDASFNGGNVHYLNYDESNEHPCPFPKETLDFILDKHLNEGDSVLDPFMGTANLGKEVLLRGGCFYGYEIDEGFYKKAEERLTQIKSESGRE